MREAIREVLAWEVERLRDPRIGFVTVTGVEVSGDLRQAAVFYTVLGDDAQRETTLRGLRSAAPRLRHALGDQVRLKHVPELDFQEDPAVVSGMRVEEILRRIHGEDEERPGPTGASPGEAAGRGPGGPDREPEDQG